MYDRLRKRFIAMSVAVLFLVGLIVMASVYGLVNAWLNRQAATLAGAILENGGTKLTMESVAENRTFDFVILPEMIYETRYFSVSFTPKEEPESINISSIASVDEHEAVRLARHALARRHDEGQLFDGRNRVYYYAYRQEDDGGSLVVVVSNSSRYLVLKTVTRYMGGVMFLVVVLFFTLMTFYSRRLIEPFEENERRQKSFITNASHELKTPLAVILANNEMVEARGGENKWTQSTARQIARMQRLIGELVTLARMEESEETALEDTDLSAIVRESADSFEEIYAKAGLSFEKQIADEIHVMGSPRGLQEILSVLLDNAGKYCDPGGSIVVNLGRQRFSRGVRLSVSNTYAAGKDLDVNRFFERFYREDESHHDSLKKGFGIGLSMARELAGRMKAKLHAGYEGDRITFYLDF